ncbi:cytochrome c biogenesis protein [Archaeoglobus profundus]|uniref:Cytochrome c assembly protein n=1 Tax=Archaeoglobus profundus (strain DSM 5631 / JCM 9629 / NBRC 100127 / Av18) TaxID=572546 RepID=D2RHC8_ARCPA|nr:cytochrome c biogenesis protein CcsA [Archaeoglobus profundus]ADB57703.1 cytochrome c assembly protein [Archaeoglobus profundus DSM 5631]
MILVFLIALDIATVIYSVFFGYYPNITLFDATCYRILYIHVPLAWNMYIAFTLTFAFSLAYLLKENPKFDAVAFCSAVLGILYGVGAIISGMLWAKEVWGSYWSWDPRQTTTLTALLAYIGYLALRSSILEIERARRISSVFGVSAYITIPLSFVSAVVVQSLHTQLPQQPLGEEAHILLALRVIVSFATFLALLRMYYTSVMRKFEEKV